MTAPGDDPLLLESYLAMTPANRALNPRRYRFRAIASSHLVRADKLGYPPGVVP